MKKDSVQQSLFGNVKNNISMEEYKKSFNKKPKQHEKKYMDTIIKTANSLDLPCFHIDYFCGNRFFPTCSGFGSFRHAPAKAVCPICRKPVLATCVNRINKGLSGHYDIIGIDWAVECKHKTNKGKQIAKPSSRQAIKGLYYDIIGIPNIVVNEDNDLETFQFLKTIHNNKYPERII